MDYAAATGMPPMQPWQVKLMQEIDKMASDTRLVPFFDGARRAHYADVAKFIETRPHDVAMA